jgi:hypothetical protein
VRSSTRPKPGAKTTRRFKRGESVALVLGAGATKACDGPLTAEILPGAFAATGGRQLELLDRFLKQIFNVPAQRARRQPADYPPLPTLLSLIDTAISREHDFGAAWPTTTLRQVRRQAEYAVFRAIAHSMRKASSWANRCHETLVGHIHQQTGLWPTVLSLNYDLRVDYALIETDGGGIPNYGCDIRNQEYQDATKIGRLFKIHGSMHWLYCPTCHRLEMGIDKQGRLRKTGLSLAWSVAHDFVDGMSEQGIHCPDCNTRFRTVMITPTSLKDYRNPHIASLWYQAERALRECRRVVFVGYSLPWDDVDVIYLLKRGLRHLRGDQITVVEWSKRFVPIDKHEVGLRYQAVFGRGLDWQPRGFAGWVKTLG